MAALDRASELRNKYPSARPSVKQIVSKTYTWMGRQVDGVVRGSEISFVMRSITFEDRDHVCGQAANGCHKPREIQPNVPTLTFPPPRAASVVTGVCDVNHSRVAL